MEKNDEVVLEGKSKGIAMVLALVGGLFGVNGLGHFYLEKIKEGTIIFVVQIIIYTTGIYLALFGPPPSYIWNPDYRGMGYALLILYFVFYAAQAVNIYEISPQLFPESRELDIKAENRVEIKRLLDQLDKRLAEGRISEETYKELKEKYEQKLKSIKKEKLV